jgi:hypothetical protein
VPKSSNLHDLSLNKSNAMSNSPITDSIPLLTWVLKKNQQNRSVGFLCYPLYRLQITLHLNKIVHFCNFTTCMSRTNAYYIFVQMGYTLSLLFLF